jgi:asparagine synthase (glutamine-hydrolysing)
VCGIAGFAGSNNFSLSEKTLISNLDKIRHRGPDSTGTFLDPENSVGIGMRRLSILDIDGGSQPIGNETQEIQVVLNGEIYNYIELRQELVDRGHLFKTQTDTEVLVHLYEEHGLGMINKLRGMFCFALYDVRSNKLFLAKDRLGKKPCYYHFSNGCLTFCSELAPLVQSTDLSREISPEALSLYLANGYIPSPLTIYKDIKKLQPAHYLVWENNTLNKQRYWSLEHKPNCEKTLEEWALEFEVSFRESVNLRLRSDVDLGLLLSGGLDSNAVLAMVSQLGYKIKTFTVGFDEQEFDESSLASLSASHFGMEHHSLIGNPDLLDYLPKIVSHYGEPFADKSALPSFFLCDQISKHLKVALNGDGGDELFAGYPKYRNRSALKILYSLPTNLRNKWIVDNFVGNGILGTRPIRNLRRKFLPETESVFTSEFFTGHSFKGIAKPSLMQIAQCCWTKYTEGFWERSTDSVNRMLSWDYDHYLVDDLLVKMDIASMAHGLEVRSPFLDQELVQKFAGMPPELKLNKKKGKLPLYQYLKGKVPEQLLNSKKKGFSVPIGKWFRTSAKCMIKDNIETLHPALDQFIEKKFLSRIFTEHQSGKKDHSQRLYNFLILNTWARNQI